MPLRMSNFAFDPPWSKAWRLIAWTKKLGIRSDFGRWLFGVCKVRLKFR